LQLANKNHLSHVIRVVGPDVRDLRGPSLQLRVISGFDKAFQFGHHLVELLDRIIPFLGVKVVKGFVVVTAELLLRLSLELGQFLPVPEQQMIGQLADRVVPACVLPTGLFCRKTFHGHVDRNKDSLRITRLHVYDGENQHPTTADRKPHEEYDKEWGVKDQRGNFAGFTELGQAAVDASKALINCVIKAASVSHPDKEFRWMAEARVVNRYLLVDQRLLDANTLEDRKKWQEKVKKSEEERKQKQFDKYEMHR